jgi:TonB family protein
VNRFEPILDADPSSLHLMQSLKLLEELQERRSWLRFSTQTFSTLVHVGLLFLFVRLDLTIATSGQRYGSGYQFGQAVMLTSPLFELGDQNAVRGRQQNIPLSALVPNQKLIAPDLRKLGLRPLKRDEPGRIGQSDLNQGMDTSLSTLSVTSRGGGALPSPSGLSRSGRGPALPFDMVPPSNTRARKTGEDDRRRIVVGDVNVLGGGSREGYRLPGSPARVGTSIEVEISSSSAPEMGEYLSFLLSRLRRSCFELMPDRRDLGPPGMVVLSLTVDAAGRIRTVVLATSSGNPELDSRAREAISNMPAFHPLPASYTEPQLRATVRIRYGSP